MQKYLLFVVQIFYFRGEYVSIFNFAYILQVVCGMCSFLFNQSSRCYQIRYYLITLQFLALTSLTGSVCRPNLKGKFVFPQIFFCGIPRYCNPWMNRKCLQPTETTYNSRVQTKWLPLAIIKDGRLPQISPR